MILYKERRVFKMEEKLTEELKKEIEAQDQYDLPDVAEVEGVNYGNC